MFAHEGRDYKGLSPPPPGMAESAAMPRHCLCIWLIVAAALPALAVEPLKIQDNSFLVEEAYNQEPRVVQHIFAMLRDGDHHWTGTFTQEWPAGGLAHQLSYTLPLDGST